MSDETIPTIRLYGVALGVAVAAAVLGVPAMVLAHQGGPDASAGLILAASLVALAPAAAAGWALPSRWAAGLAGAIGVSCASFFTTAPALDVALVGPMFEAAASPVGPDGMAEALAASVREVLLGGWGFAWFVAAAGAVLGGGVAWARGSAPGRITTSEAPTVAVLSLAVSLVALTSGLESLAASMDAMEGAGFRLGLGLQLSATAALTGALGGYLVRGPSSPGRWVAGLLAVGAGLGSIGLSALLSLGWIPWLAVGWVGGFAAGWWGTGDVRRRPSGVLQHALGEALGVGLCLPFVLAVSGVGVGLAAALGPVALIGAASGEGSVDLTGVAHSVLYGRTMAWPVLMAGIGPLLFITPVRWMAQREERAAEA